MISTLEKGTKWTGRKGRAQTCRPLTWDRFSLARRNNNATVSKRHFFWSSSDHSDEDKKTNDNFNDTISNKYRFQQVTSLMSDEFQVENERTIQCLDPTVCQQMLYRIHDALEADLEQQHQSDTINDKLVGEPGPTGKWLYRFDLLNDDDDSESDRSRRVYSRHSVPVVRDDINNQTTRRIVLELCPTEELIAMSLTPDESCVAALVQRHDNDVNGVDITIEIRLRNIESGVENRIRIPTKHTNTSAETVISLEWGSDVLDVQDDLDPLKETRPYPHHTICFLHTNHQGQPNRVLSTRINPTTMDLINNELPTTIFNSEDPAVMVSMQRTKGGKFIAIDASTKTSNEIHLTTGNPSTPLRLVKPREDNVMYHIDAGVDVNTEEESVVMLVGDNQVYEIPVSCLPISDLLSSTATKAYVRMDPNENSITDIDVFQRHIILYERSKRTGDQHIRIMKRSTHQCSYSESSMVHLPEANFLPWTKISPYGNMKYDSSSLTVRLESAVHAGAEYEIDFDTSEVMALRSSRSSEYFCEKVFVKSNDGTDIPLSLFFKTGGATEDILLACYGAYGEPIGHDYSPMWKALLDHGMVLAFAHTRGGNELGKEWHHAGIKENKVRGIEDLEACAFYLRKRFTRGHIAAYGFSAGGILVGAAVNRHPGLFDKVLLVNAFLDVLETMKTPSLFLTVHEYDEYGNPSAHKNIERNISSYCPISNLIAEDQKQSNTKFFIIGTLDDANVPYWNSAIYFSKLLCNKQQSMALYDDDDDINRNRPLLYMNAEGGHNLNGRRLIEIYSYILAFLLRS
jgi:protease II